MDPGHRPPLLARRPFSNAQWWWPLAGTNEPKIRYGRRNGGLEAKGAQVMAPASPYSWASVRAAALLAGATVASSCVASSSHSLQQVRASNPSVTYAYSGDEELLQAEQNAVTFCSQYNSTPQPARITSNPNGGSSDVTFECGPNPTAAVVAQPVPGPNLTYSYRTDQELLQASRTAEAYCTSNGSRRVVSNITTNVDGSKTVVFQCTAA
jgi:hypothetical protein